MTRIAAKNVIAYVEAIYNMLVSGGLWINLGTIHSFVHSSEVIQDLCCIILPICLERTVLNSVMSSFGM